MLVEASLLLRLASPDASPIRSNLNRAGATSLVTGDVPWSVPGTPARVAARPVISGYAPNMSATLLWIIAVVLVVVGVVQLLQGQVIFGALLIVAGFLVGPGGYSIARR
jgi:hypothetical protein